MDWTAVAIVFILFGLPTIAVFNYLGKSKSSQVMTTEDEKVMTDLWKLSKALETRLENLERILEKDHSRWSDKNDKI